MLKLDLINTLAFAPLFEQAGVPAAATVAVAAAMVGIVSGGLIGGPIGTHLVERHGLREARRRPLHIGLPTAANVVEGRMPEPAAAAPHGEDKESYAILNITAGTSVGRLSPWGAVPGRLRKPRRIRTQRRCLNNGQSTFPN